MVDTKAADKVAKDLHMEEICSEEREMLPPLSKAERRRYLQVREPVTMQP